MEVGKMNVSGVKSRYQKRNQKTKSMSFDSKKSATSTQKPAYSYAELIAQAIISVPTYKLPLNKIYEWISTNYPFYKLSETGWQNSIRHNLSLNNSFCKVQRTEDDPGKGCYWTIVKDQRQKFENLLSKKVGAKITAVINKRTNPKKRYNTFSDSESDLSESEYEDEDDMLYKDKIIIRPKKMRKIENSDDMAYTEKNKYNKNKKNKKLVKVSRKSSTTQVPASPTPSPILTKRESNFSENKKFNEVEEESDSMIMEEETSEDEYENYPPSPQSPDLPPIHTHKNYDFTFDLFPESPRLEEDDEEVEEEEEEEIKLNNVENEEVEVANSEDEEEEEIAEEEEEYEDYENEDFEFEGENQDPLPTIKISKSAVSLYDDMQNQTQNQEEELTTENETVNEMVKSVPIQKETLLHDKDDDVNVLEKYNNTYLSDYHGIDHNYNCYINDELDKQYNYYLHSPIFNSLTCPELADMCFGVNLNTLDYSSLNEDYKNITDKLDFVDMGVENWWRDETNNYPIYG